MFIWPGGGGLGEDGVLGVVVVFFLLSNDYKFYYQAPGRRRRLKKTFALGPVSRSSHIDLPLFSFGRGGGNTE